MRLASIIVVPVVTLLALPVAEAHISQISPTPRTQSQKEGPCGAAGSTRGEPQVFRPGETITVEWDETVDHPGHYRIAFDPDGEDDFPLPNQPDDNFATTLVDQITDKAGGLYSQEITFPDIECDNCTLQLIQIMTTQVPYNSFYFQCSDIVLSNATSETGPDAGVNPTKPASGGGCASSGGASGTASLFLALALLVLRKRRQMS